MELFEEDLRIRPAVTYEKRSDLLYEMLGIWVSKKPTICQVIKRLGYTRKKISECSTKRRMLRAAWRVTLAKAVDPRRLVFVGEMGTNVALSPLYAYAPKGSRTYAERKSATLMA